MLDEDGSGTAAWDLQAVASVLDIGIFICLADKRDDELLDCI